VSAAPAEPTHAPGGVTAEPLRRKLIRPIVFAVVAGIAAIFLLPKVPRTQQVRLHLGVGASRVVSATARVGRDGAWDRETTWHFDRGAPASVDWAFDLPNGPANVEVELETARSTDQRTVQLELHGGETKVELSDVTRGLE